MNKRENRIRSLPYATPANQVVFANKHTYIDLNDMKSFRNCITPILITTRMKECISPIMTNITIDNNKQIISDSLY